MTLLGMNYWTNCFQNKKPHRGRMCYSFNNTISKNHKNWNPNSFFLFLFQKPEIFFLHLRIRKRVLSRIGFQYYIKKSKKDVLRSIDYLHYIVAPLLSIKMRWCTEIAQIVENRYFSDEERFGPYKM